MTEDTDKVALLAALREELTIVEFSMTSWTWGT